MKKLMAGFLTLLLLIMAGCSTQAPAPSSVPEESSSESVVSEEESVISSEALGEPIPSDELSGTEELPSGDELAESFLQALKNGDTAAIEGKVWDYSLREAGGFGYIKDLKLGEITHSKLPSESMQCAAAGTYELTMEVLDAGKTTLKLGKNQYILDIRSTGYDGPAMYYSITPVEKFISPELIAESKAAEQVVRARDFGFMWNPFESADDLKDDLDVEYLLSLECEKYPDGMTQEQMDAAALKYYGAKNGFDRKTSRYYDKEKQLYIMWGRDGGNSSERVTRIDRRDEGDVFVYVETYTDSLQICLDKTMEYHLADNGDGTYRYITARYVTPVE